MIRLVFARLGLQTELDGADVIVPGDQQLMAQRDVGEYKAKVQDGPWPAFPADLTSIAIALATQCSGSVLIHEWMFENRMIFTDKLVVMGADITLCDPHRAIVTGPSRLRGERMESPGHPRRHGDAHRRAVRRGAQRDRQRAARSIAATSASTSACATSAARSSGSPASPRACDPPHPERNPRRAPRRDAGAARDHRRAARRLRAATATARSTRRRSSTSRSCAAATAACSRPTGWSTTTATCSRCART